MAEFEAARYITRVNGADYLEVKWRLVWLRDRHPEAEVETLLVAHDAIERGNGFVWRAVFKAVVRLPSGGLATGYGNATRDDFRDYLEKAETKAIGRALAALGFGTQFAPDHDFGAAVDRVVDSPVRSGKVGDGPRWPFGERPNPHGPKINDGQWKYLHVLGKENMLDHDDLKAQAWTLYGRRSTKNLSKAEADDLQERIRKGRLVDAEMPPDEAAERTMAGNGASQS